MKKSNYALVSALYSNKTMGLYSDIYFPIIRYALVKIFSEKVESDTYSSADKVAEYIDEKFGIHIPTIVIAKSITKISMQKDENLQLVISLSRQETDVRRLMPLLTQRLKRASSPLQSCQENEQCSNTAFAP